MSSNSGNQSSSARDYNQENLEIIARILECNANEYHRILNIDENATEEDIKKSFTILAKLVHPDKNSAPGATKVFMRVNNAYIQLMKPFTSNKETRNKDQETSNFQNYNSYQNSETNYNSSPETVEDRGICHKIFSVILTIWFWSFIILSYLVNFTLLVLGGFIYLIYYGLIFSLCGLVLVALIVLFYQIIKAAI